MPKTYEGRGRMIVSVIIPAWNLWDSTFACLQSLAKYDNSRMEVVVVDNGSTDDTYLHLQHVGIELFGKRFVWVRHEDNLGFAIACNAGATASHGDVLFFLNNDTSVTENWLPPLVETLNEPNIVAVGPLLLYPDGTCQHCGVSFTPLRNPFHLYANFPGNHPVLRTRHPLQAITGAALMVRHRDFFDAGMFHPGYRNGFEDLDLCCRLRAKGGELAISPESVIIHHESKTPGRHNNENHNAELFTERCGDKIRPDMHIQVALDGYQLRLSPRFTSYVIAAKEKNSLLKNQSNLSVQTIERILQQEPLWLDGYVKLVGALEHSGEYEQALNVASLAMRFFPLEKVQRLVYRCAKRINNEEVAKATLRLLQSNIITKENRKTAQYFRNQALKWGDNLLAEIFDYWLSEYKEQKIV